MLMVGWEGTDAAEPVALVERLRPGGLIFFRRNYPAGGGPELARILAAAKAKARRVCSWPPLVALDNEGGLVRRLPEPFLQLPKASESGPPGEVRELARLSGLELAALGFNLNLAPVLDVDTSGRMMRERCFGSDPAVVAAKGLAFMEGFREAGLACCAKHFPGLGHAAVDPHEDLPAVDLGAAEIERIHLAPFIDLCGRGLGLAMTTHCRYPALDPDRPATFSAKVVGRLRSALGPDGLILSDDLEMGAVVKNLGIGEAAVAALEAGHDMVLVCRRPEAIAEAADAVERALASGRLDPSRPEMTVRRLRAALAGAGGLGPDEEGPGKPGPGQWRPRGAGSGQDRSDEQRPDEQPPGGAAAGRDGPFKRPAGA
jgi:beta-N-acetylhexosaminidase